MALTSKERHSVIYFLGWPSKTLDAASTHYSKIVSDRLAALSVDGEIRVREVISKLEKIREQLDEAQCRLSTSSVDNIELSSNEMNGLWGLEKKYLCIMSDLTDIPTMKSCTNSISLVV